ncbi:MAG: hypothetical protein RIR70_1928 [Pseudomonadota bacterium]
MTPLALRPMASAHAARTPDALPPSEPNRWPGFSRLPSSASGSAFRPHAPRLRAPDHREVHEIAGFRVEIADTRGFRREHEDAFFVGRFDPVRNDPRNALLDAFRDTDRITRNNDCGATCTVAVVGVDRRITLAHLGDSPAMLFVLSGETGDVHFQSLLRSHNTHDSVEKARVEYCHTVECLRLENNPLVDEKKLKKWLSMEDVTRRGRILIPDGGSLSVSRAFGDRDYDWALGRQPHITQINLAERLPGLSHQDRVFLVVSCDGLTEVPSQDFELAQRWLADCFRRTLKAGNDDHLAEHLITHAYQHSHDNITAMVTEIPNVPGYGSGAVVIGVADGHGGHTTARQVAANMSRLLCGGVMF